MSLYRNAGVGIGGVLLIAFILFNAFGGVIAGIWLGFKGQWAALAFGLAAVWFVPTLWAFVIFPIQLGIIASVRSRVERGLTGEVLLPGFVAALWAAAGVAAWVQFAFLFFANHIEPGTSIPMLIWGYAAVMGPLQYMASKEPDDGENVGSGIALLQAMLSYALVTILYLWGAQPATWTYCLFGFAILVAILNTAYVALLMNEEKRMRVLWGAQEPVVAPVSSRPGNPEA